MNAVAEAADYLAYVKSLLIAHASVIRMTTVREEAQGGVLAGAQVIDDDGAEYIER